jgi:hypothetical protein
MYDRCITVLNYDNWTNLTEEEKRKNSEKEKEADKDSCHRDPVHDREMTREEVNFYAELGKKFSDKWDSKERDKDSDDGNTALMTTEEESKEDSTPLHDMTFVGIDTCSARSISCDPDDFLELNHTPRYENRDHLRGVGGASLVAGKGVLVFYVRDIYEKIKAIIEPKGFYLKDAPAKFRILGQQKMKQKGINLIQDYDNEGTDILKCKRSDAVLPLDEKGKILLLKTIKYRPNEELKQKLRDYATNLLKKNNSLPHVIDLEELNVGAETVVILNEGKLTNENYERLLHWRFGHTSSKVLQAMDLIEKSHLNEDCYLRKQKVLN